MDATPGTPISSTDPIVIRMGRGRVGPIGAMMLENVRKHAVLLALAAVALVVVMPLLTFRGIPQGRELGGIYFTGWQCVAMIVVFFMAIIVGSLILEPVRWRVRRSETPDFDVEYVFSDDQIIVRNTAGETIHDWAFFQTSKLSGDYYLVLPVSGSSGTLFVPRKAFDTPEQESAFRDLLRRRLDFSV